MTNVIKITKSDKLMPQQLKQIDRIAELLTNLNCEFRIRTPEGYCFDNILLKNRGKGHLSLDDSATTTHTEQKPRIKRGEMKAYLDNILGGIKLGEVRVIPIGKFNGLNGTFSNYVSGYASRIFGNGSYSVSWDNADRSVLFHLHGGL
jgi:hypothetical protein